MGLLINYCEFFLRTCSSFLPRLTTFMSKQLLDTASKHPLSFVGLVDQAWNTARDAAFKTGWRPMTRLAEAAVVAYVFMVLLFCALVNISFSGLE
jgi:hypothetical protein